MKTAAFCLLATAAGLGIGWLLPVSRSGGSAADEAPVTRVSSGAAERAKRGWMEKSKGQGDRMSAFAERTLALGPGDWPGFFRNQLNSPEWSDIAAMLWADQDPAGFWRFLREEGDPLLIERFANDLLVIWTHADPDAAMAAVMRITDKATGDLLRRAVVDTALTDDLAKGLELAARAGDFNRFGWGDRPWMHHDPEAAVRGLAALPKISKYRNFLDYAITAWAAKDPLAAMKWIRDENPLRGETGLFSDRWVTKGFEAAAKADPQAARTVALEISDPFDRDRALAGVIAAGNLPRDAALELVAGCSPTTAQQASIDLIRSMPLKSRDDIEAATDLMLKLPIGSRADDMLDSVARAMEALDPNAAWDWADSLPEPALRRLALEFMVESSRDTQALAGKLGAIPIGDLSNKILQIALKKVPVNQQQEWIGRLPSAHAEWAREVQAQKTKGQ